MVRRLLLLFAVTGAVLVAMAAPASAKAPPFTVELSDPAPSPSERVTVTVRMWDPVNPGRLNTLYLPRPAELNNLLALVSAEDIEAGRPRPGVRQEAIELRYLRPATFRGSFVAPEHGDYRLVPFPRMEGRLLGGAAGGFMRQYPTTELAVQDGDREGGGRPVVPVTAGVAALGATFALVVAQRRRHRVRLAVNT